MGDPEIVHELNHKMGLIQFVGNRFFQTIAVLISTVHDGAVHCVYGADERLELFVRHGNGEHGGIGLNVEHGVYLSFVGLYLYYIIYRLLYQ